MDAEQVAPNWDQIPQIFKLDLIKRLDFKSCCNFRKCASAERGLVDRRPISLEFAGISAPLISSSHVSHFKLSNFSDNRTYIANVKYPTENAIADFLFLFNNKTSLVKRVDIGNFNQLELLPLFISKLSEKLKELGPGFKIRAQQLGWKSYTYSGEEFLDVFKWFDAKLLEKVEISTMERWSDDKMNEIGETEQWKNLKRVHVLNDVPISIRHFLHLESFEIQKKNATACDYWEVIMSYRNRDLPVESHFRMLSNSTLLYEQVYAKFDVPKHHEEMLRARNYTYHHIQKFPTINKDNVLLVLFNSWSVEGVVCRENHFVEDIKIAFSS
ncbi:unnamed protein product [Caenorhabditis sp. 36 PRJEB53466]|nr:unnamed protein product [Caenorhabditis sp. 36 PRJEB53466]